VVVKLSANGDMIKLRTFELIYLGYSLLYEHWPLELARVVHACPSQPDIPKAFWKTSIDVLPSDQERVKYHVHDRRNELHVPSMTTVILLTRL